MPMIRSSQEVYNYLKRKSGETGEPMSIILDRWMARELEDVKRSEDRKSTKSGDKGRSSKRAGGSSKGGTAKAEQSGRRLIEGLADVYED